jgi:2-isopropylmalate synthase
VSEEKLTELYRVHVEERVGGDCEELSVVGERLAQELAATPATVAAQ